MQMAMAVGASTTDLPYVQVHPTGLVDPKNPESKVSFQCKAQGKRPASTSTTSEQTTAHTHTRTRTHAHTHTHTHTLSRFVQVKWLAAEALRGSGGLLLDATGHRFCNELGKRDYVTGKMLKCDALHCAHACNPTASGEGFACLAFVFVFVFCFFHMQLGFKSAAHAAFLLSLSCAPVSAPPPTSNSLPLFRQIKGPFQTGAEQQAGKGI